MSIRIDKTTCIGCGRCTEACPGSLLYLTPAATMAASASKDNATKGTGKTAAIRDVRDCWGCTACLKECPVGALHYFLGADLGGTGAEMTISRESHFLHWKIALPNGETKTITIDQNEANKY